MSDQTRDEGWSEAPAVLRVGSGVSLANGQPFVTVRWGDRSGQWSPGEARQHAMQVLEAAEAAEHDAVVVRWLRERVKVDIGSIAQMIKDLRAFRTEH